jgi:hypothetical protein
MYCLNNWTKCILYYIGTFITTYMYVIFTGSYVHTDMLIIYVYQCIHIKYYRTCISISMICKHMLFELKIKEIYFIYKICESFVKDVCEICPNWYTENINKTKESFNSDGQQFHQYQQNKQSPLILTHWTHKKETKTYGVGKLDPGLGPYI